MIRNVCLVLAGVMLFAACLPGAGIAPPPVTGKAAICLPIPAEVADALGLPPTAEVCLERAPADSGPTPSKSLLKEFSMQGNDMRGLVPAYSFQNMFEFVWLGVPGGGQETINMEDNSFIYPDAANLPYRKWIIQQIRISAASDGTLHGPSYFELRGYQYSWINAPYSSFGPITSGWYPGNTVDGVNQAAPGELVIEPAFLYAMANGLFAFVLEAPSLGTPVELRLSISGTFLDSEPRSTPEA